MFISCWKILGRSAVHGARQMMVRLIGPTKAIKVPAGPEWLHEIKQDGFRIRVERDGDRVRLITRGGYDRTKRYPWIVEAARKALAPG